MTSTNKTILSVIIVVAVIIGGYFLISGSSAPVPAEDLLKVSATGGLCVYGACNSELIIKSDGFYLFRMGNEEEKRGTFSQTEINDLKSLIADGDFEAIKSKAFTEICPIAYDGQQFTYIFYTEDEILDSCAVDIDEESPLFKRIESLQTQVLS